MDKNSPKIRFVGYKKPWEQTILGNVSQSFAYGLNASAKEYDGVNKYLRITDIDDDSREFNFEDLTSPDADPASIENYQLTDGDIVFARTGASVGKTLIYKEMYGKTYYAGFLIKASIRHNYDAGFVFQNTLTDNYRKFIKITSQRSGQPGVNASEYATYEFRTPSEKTEQQSVSKLLFCIDSLIALQKERFEKMKTIKKSFLELLLADINKTIPTLRFKEFKGDWKVHKLGTECVIFAGGTPSTSISDYWDNGDINWLPSGSVQDCVINDDDIKTKITLKGLKNSSAKMIKPNTTLLAMTGATCGKSGYLMCPSSANQSVMAFETTSLDSKFLFYTFQKNKKYILQHQAGGGQAGINKNTCSNLEFLFPEKDEQIKIANLLSKIDGAITLYETRYEKLKKIKQALLSDVFI